RRHAPGGPGPVERDHRGFPRRTCRGRGRQREGSPRSRNHRHGQRHQHRAGRRPLGRGAGDRRSAGRRDGRHAGRTSERGMIALLAMLLAQSAPARVLTLAEAQRVAQERQPQLRAARGSTQAAEGRVEQSRSGLLPQLSAAADYQRSTNNFLFRPGVAARTASTSWSSVNVFDSSVTLSQLLWDFGQTSNRWRSAQASARSAADQERSTYLQITLQVRVAFFNAVANKELLAVARETLANQRNHLRQIEGF